jgi:RNA polymerase primary sigma factor
VLTDTEAYLREIGEHELLSADEELRLAQQVEAGRLAQAELDQRASELSPEQQQALQAQVVAGGRARARLIECNLRLVVSVAARYRGHSPLQLSDLVQEGNIGLHIGAERFDWRRGFRFSTYAYWWIRQAVTRAIAEKSRTIRLPVHASELLSRAARGERELYLELGRQPSLDELADHLGVEREWLCEVRRAARLPLSLEAPLTDDGDLTRGDMVDDEAAAEAPRVAAEAADLADRLTQALDELPGRERQVLRLRFGLSGEPERTLDEVASVLGVSRERIRQVESSALARLRAMPAVRRDLHEYIR